MEFHDKLKILRKEKGLTQEQLSEELNISRAAVSKWETGRGLPNIEALRNLAKIFGTPIDHLLSGEEMISYVERSSRLNLNKITSLVFALLDIFLLSFLFLPLYGNDTGSRVVMVSLSEYNTAPYIHITFFVMASLLFLNGLLEAVLQFVEFEKIHNRARTSSFVLNTLAVLVFIATGEPYASTLLFFILLSKFLILRKKYQVS